MKRMNLMLVILVISGILLACSRQVQDKDIAGKTYLYENEGFGGDFYITFFEDHTFLYTEGYLSSYIGVGTWTLEDGMLVMKDHDRTFTFLAAKDTLTFQADQSDKFMYKNVTDGERFYYDADAVPRFSQIS